MSREEWQAKHGQSRKADSSLPLRNKLNIAFILLTVLTISAYFFAPLAISRPLYISLGFAAVIIKMVEVAIRINSQKKNR